MNISRRAFYAFTTMLAILCQINVASAQGELGATADELTPQRAFGLSASQFGAVLEYPDLRNKVLIKQLIEDGPLKRFADTVRINFNVFEVEGGDSSLGLSWEYKKSLSSYTFQEDSAIHTGLDIGLDSRGNLAFDAEVNPKDFLEIDLSLSVIRSQGGVIRRATPAQARKFMDVAKGLAGLSEKELANSQLNRDLIQDIRSLMNTQWYTEVSGDVGYETDQKFNNQQLRFGSHLALDVKAWNSNDLLAKLNVLDYPFALTRWLAGNEDNWRPSGAALPTFLAGIDYVTPTENELRSAAGDTSDFFRFKAEISYRSLVADIFGAPTFFEANLRYYKEINPSGQIEAASLDKQTLFTMALLFPRDFYISYSEGKLPFDLADEQVFSMGFKIGF